MDHSAFLLEYDTPSPGDEPAWQTAQTEIGAPTFDRLHPAAEPSPEPEPSSEIDVEVDRFIDEALTEHAGSEHTANKDTASEDTRNEDATSEDATSEDAANEDAANEDAANEDAAPALANDDIDIDVNIEPQADWQPDSLERDLALLDPEGVEPNVSIEVEIDLVSDEERVELDISIAKQSDSHFWEGLDGEYGVFLATYETLEIGTRAQVQLHVMGQSFSVPATVRWLRNENTGIWPGIGLELDAPADDLVATIRRFGDVRPAMFHCF
ncbi:MAG: hypothetical protein AAGE52_38940 [Myxococcota bacterium]